MQQTSTSVDCYPCNGNMVIWVGSQKSIKPRNRETDGNALLSTENDTYSNASCFLMYVGPTPFIKGNLLAYPPCKNQMVIINTPHESLILNDFVWRTTGYPDGFSPKR